LLHSQEAKLKCSNFLVLVVSVITSRLLRNQSTSRNLDASAAGKRATRGSSWRLTEQAARSARSTAVCCLRHAARRSHRGSAIPDGEPAAPVRRWANTPPFRTVTRRAVWVRPPRGHTDVCVAVTSALSFGGGLRCLTMERPPTRNSTPRSPCEAIRFFCKELARSPSRAFEKGIFRGVRPRERCVQADASPP